MSSFAQTSGLKFTKILPVQGDTMLLDPGFIAPGSITINGYSENSDFKIFQNNIIWLGALVSDSISVSYQVLRFKISYQNKDKSVIRRTYIDNPFSYTPSRSETEVEYGNLRTAGNVSRGIGFGNAQDLVVNSNLNLRIKGTLANDVDVLAVISDENNPIQPEGNTQQIQDFDQVFITLTKDSSKITVGDFLMKRPQDSYFINYYKKSRGLQYQGVSRTSKGWRVSNQAELAMSRGRFSRNTINGIEGNSGPYRLSGDNGETFIIVIAGTENVFLDGKKLSRGENNDYVVNYNTGEITFTPKILITRYSRIVVEFQYSDRNYGRSVAHLGTSLSKGKFTIYTNGFNEMDLKSQPFLQSLDAFDSIQNKSAINVLAESGDQQAFISNVSQLQEYNQERIMYTRQIFGGDFVYVYASEPSVLDTFYDVSFTNVGSGNGSYAQAQTGANGKVFEYVGDNFGDYVPVEILIAPKRLNTFNIGMVFKEDGKTSGIEYSLSSFDDNTFSSLDDEDNLGFGLKMFRKTDRLLSDSSAWRWKSDINYELVNGNFNFVERYRTVEFDRKWSKVLENPSSFSVLVPSFEHIGNANFGLVKSDRDFLKNSTAVFLRPGNFTGFSNLTTGGVRFKNLVMNSRLELMNSNTSVSDSSELINQFYSISANIQRAFKKIVAGFDIITEQSTFTTDSLLNQSYGFDRYQAFIKNTDSTRLRYNLVASQRTDRLPQNEAFSNSTIGRDISLSSSYKTKTNQQINLSTIYRQLEILDTTLSSKALENTLQSRLELNLNFFKKFIRSRTFYEIGTGQEQRREFQYLKVQPGNGVYVWNDYDSNGLKTLNEFEIASELDRQRADHIKIFTPVAGFFTTQSTRISQTLELNPSVFVKKQTKKRPFYSRFNSISTLILDKKVLPNEGISLLNLFDQNLTDTSLISSSQNLRSTLFFNRGNSKYSVDLTFIQGGSKVLLTNGFDSRENLENVLNVRVNLGRQFTLTSRARAGGKKYESQFFSNNDFDYQFIELEPNLQLLFKKLYRIELLTKYFTAVNEVSLGGETSESFEIGGVFKYAKASKGTFDAGASFIRVNFDGSTSTNLGYELLRGLQDGNNATWKLGYQRTLANNIQVVVSYDGRKSEDAPIIHIGRLVARYLF